MLKPIERKSPAWRRGEKKGEGYGKENPTPILSFQQVKICQNCRYFSDSWGVMTVITLCRITGFRVLGGDRGCELFTPFADNPIKSCLTLDNVKGKLDFPKQVRHCRAFAASQAVIKNGFLYFSALFAAPLWLRRILAEHVPEFVRTGRPYLCRGACSAFLRLVTCN